MNVRRRGRGCDFDEALLRRIAAAIRDGRPGTSVRLTRLVDGMSTYTAEVQGLPAREFDDRDDATEWAGNTASLIQAQAVARALDQGIAFDSGSPNGHCPACKHAFKDGETCHMGGCPMGGDF